MLRHPRAIRLAMRGIDYQHYRSLCQPWLRSMDIRTVLDVGANVGQFARLVHEVLPAARVISFEPLPECFERLRLVLPEGPDFHPQNYALGDAAGELEIYRCSHSPSSSFLRMKALHYESFPQSAGGDRDAVRVVVRRLDDVASELSLEGRILLKLDVQGYEDRVLAGARRTLDRVQVVLMETCFLSFYEGQPLFDDLHPRMASLGFTYRGALEQYYHPVDGRVVMADSFFVRGDR